MIFHFSVATKLDYSYGLLLSLCQTLSRGKEKPLGHRLPTLTIRKTETRLFS